MAGSTTESNPPADDGWRAKYDKYQTMLSEISDVVLVPNWFLPEHIEAFVGRKITDTEYKLIVAAWHEFDGADMISADIRDWLCENQKDLIKFFQENPPACGCQTNPPKRWSKASKVQSVIFGKDRWSIKKAKDWLRLHGFKYGSVDETPSEIRFRQFEPTDFKDFRSIPFGEGHSIRALVAQPNPPSRKRALITWVPGTEKYKVAIVEIDGGRFKTKKVEFEGEQALIDGLWEIWHGFFMNEDKEQPLCPITTEWVAPNPFALSGLFCTDCNTAVEKCSKCGSDFSSTQEIECAGENHYCCMECAVSENQVAKNPGDDPCRYCKAKRFPGDTTGHFGACERCKEKPNPDTEGEYRRTSAFPPEVRGIFPALDARTVFRMLRAIANGPESIGYGGRKGEHSHPGTGLRAPGNPFYQLPHGQRKHILVTLYNAGLIGISPYPSPSGWGKEPEARALVNLTEKGRATLAHVESEKHGGKEWQGD